MTDRDRLIELISQIQYMGGLESRLADHLLANGVIVPPCKVGDLPNRIFSHNSIIALWVEIPKEHYSQRLWRGMAWNIPEEYKELQFKRIFGSVPENIYESDTINILVELTKEEAEAELRKRSEDNGNL